MNCSVVKKIVAYFVVAFAVCIPYSSFAAILSLIPNTSSVAVGNIITVSAVVNSQGKAINNGDAIIQFPTDLLQVVSVDTSGSVFSLWVENPGFSNTSGQIMFNGGVPNPGFSGSSGKIVSVTFVAKKAGTASVLIGDSSVRANDGLGTDVLSGKSNATISINGAAAQPVPAQITPVVQPTIISTASLITSSTHPNQNKWYNSKNVVLNWVVPTNAKSTQTLLSTRPDSTPTVSNTPSISTKELEGVDDGVLYFHMRNLTDAGWSKTSHFRIQIDSVQPDNLIIDASDDGTGQVNVVMSAKDSLSGIDHYTLQVDQGQTIVVKADAFGVATSTVTALDKGAHTFNVSAFDKAGNHSEKTATMNGSALLSVAVTDSPSSIKVGNTITLSGISTQLNSNLVVSLTNGSSKIATYKVNTDTNGAFHFASDAITEAGNVVAWVDIVNTQGVSLSSSNKVSIEVKKPLLIQIGTYTTELISVLIPLFALLFLLVYMIYYAWHKFYRIKHHFKKDLDVAQKRIHEAFKTLSEETTEQLLQFENTSKNKKLTLKEQKAVNDLKKAVEQVDEYVQKIVEKIKKTDL